MDSDDVVLRPESTILYRQSSVEIRLSPVHFSEESDDALDNDTAPKVVDVKPKIQINMDYKGPPITPPPSRKSSSEEQIANKEKFMEDLQKKLSVKYDTTLAKPEEKIPNYRQLKEQNDKSPTKSYTSEYKQPRKIMNLSTRSKNFVKVEEEEPEGRFLDHPEATEKIQRNSMKKKTCKVSTDISLENTKGLQKPSGSKAYVKEKSDTEREQNSSKSKPVLSNIKDDGLSKEINYYFTRERDNTLRPNEEKEDSTVTDRDRRADVNINRSSKSKQRKMAAVRPKSPRQQGTLKNDKEESIWEKIGTLARKKRIKEVQEVEAVESEGKYAIESPGNPVIPDIPPEDYELGENEERSMVEPKELEDPKVQELIQVLIEWINDELASQRIIVQDLAEDLYDGQVLQKLLEKLTGDKLDVPEVTQSEEGQKQKLAVVLAHFNKVLGIQRFGHNKWNVEAIHSKNIVPIMHLLVALARHFRPPVRLPEHVSVKVVVVQKTGGQLATKKVREKITTAYDDVGMRCERDAFDTLFDHAPDKLKVVKKSLVTFVNKHLNKINLEVTEIESQFHDGVYLIMLMGLLEGFFVPLYSFFPTPKDFDQKVHNVAFAFELMEEVGLQRPKARPEDVVNMDLKSTLRVLYNLFLKYRNVL